MMENIEKKKDKKSVRIYKRKEAEKALKEETEGRQGAATATLNNIPTPPRKMRLIANMVRGRRVYEALNILKFDSKIGSGKLEKLLQSAIANWQNKNQDVDLEEADLYIKEIYVNGGKMLKRLRPAPQGRGHRIRKRSNHVTMVIDSLNKPDEMENLPTDSDDSDNSNKDNA